MAQMAPGDQMTANRRRVTMPAPKKVRPRQHAVFPKRRAVPPLGWPLKRHDWMALIATACLTAVLWQFRHVFFLICAVWFLGRTWFWLCRRHPLVGWFLLGFLRGLLGRR